MDIPALSMALSDMKVREQINVSMLKQAINSQEEQGEIIVDLIEDMGEYIDILI